MITFKNFIIEVFAGNNAYDWEVVSPSDPMLITFEIGNEENYFVAVNQRRNPGNVIEYNVAFSKGSSGRDRDRAMGLSGEFSTKIALKIYNTVINILRARLKPMLKSGDSIVFESYDLRTKKLYHKFAMMIAKEINGSVATSGGTFTVYKK